MSCKYLRAIIKYDVYFSRCGTLKSNGKEKGLKIRKKN